jgi:hypothetical protein
MCEPGRCRACNCCANWMRTTAQPLAQPLAQPAVQTASKLQNRPSAELRNIVGFSFLSRDCVGHFFCSFSPAHSKFFRQEVVGWDRSDVWVAAGSAVSRQRSGFNVMNNEWNIKSAPTFDRLVFGCIEADFYSQLLMLQELSRSTRFANFCTVPNSKNQLLIMAKMLHGWIRDCSSMLHFFYETYFFHFFSHNLFLMKISKLLTYSNWAPIFRKSQNLSRLVVWWCMMILYLQNTIIICVLRSLTK